MPRVPSPPLAPAASHRRAPSRPHARAAASHNPMAILERQLEDLDRDHLLPESARVRLAHQQVRRLVQGLRDSGAWMFDVDETLQHGSLSRGTALRTFDDIDTLVVLDQASLRTQQGLDRTPEDTIRRMSKTLSQAFEGPVSRGELRVRPQTHSVGVTFSALQLRVDLVPAIRTDQGLQIPSRRAGEWISTWPDQARLRLNAVAAENPWVKRAVRLMKGWRMRAGLPLSSYAMETIVLDRAAATDKRQAGFIYGIFKELDAAHGGRRLDLVPGSSNPSPVRVTDPFSGANITEDLDARDRMQLIEASRTAFRTLKALLQTWEDDPFDIDSHELEELFVPLQS